VGRLRGSKPARRPTRGVLALRARLSATGPSSSRWRPGGAVCRQCGGAHSASRPLGIYGRHRPRVDLRWAAAHRALRRRRYRDLSDTRGGCPRRPARGCGADDKRSRPCTGARYFAGVRPARLAANRGWHARVQRGAARRPRCPTAR
jgi:hypothetical protein